MTDHLLLRPGFILQERLRCGELEPTALFERCHERAQAISALNAFQNLEPELGRGLATASAYRHRRDSALGHVDGLPVALKDSLTMRGSVSRMGSPTTDDVPSDKDGPVTATLRRQGFVLAGRTTMPQFGWKGVTDSPLFGAAKNPWDPARTPGGSSGGNAIALATGAAAVAIGTDIGGSVRIPASFCGVVGFKPTQDRAPKRPGSHSGFLSREGPMARSVLDCAHLMDVIELRDATDRSERFGRGHFEGTQEGDLLGLEVAVLLDHPELDVDPEVAKVVREAGQALEDLGCRVVEIDRDKLDLSGLRETYERLYAGDISENTRPLSKEQRQQLDPGLRELTDWVEDMPVTAYLDASQSRQRFMQTTHTFFHAWDLLLMPTVAILPFETGRNVPANWSDSSWTSWAGFTWPLNLTGQPALSLPGGFSKENLPIGVQLCAARGHDGLVLKAGHLLERLLAVDVARRMNERLPTLLQ